MHLLVLGVEVGDGRKGAVSVEARRIDEGRRNEAVLRRSWAPDSERLNFARMRGRCWWCLFEQCGSGEGCPWRGARKQEWRRRSGENGVRARVWALVCYL